MDKYHKLTLLLANLSQELARFGYWQEFPPCEDMLASSEPFSMDTLSCTEWLQWVFISKMHQLINERLPLPMSLAISPYVEMALTGFAGQQALTRASKNIDTYFNAITK